MLNVRKFKSPRSVHILIPGHWGMVFQIHTVYHDLATWSQSYAYRAMLMIFRVHSVTRECIFAVRYVPQTLVIMHRRTNNLAHSKQ
jgi:hypothetical protein